MWKAVTISIESIVASQSISDYSSIASPMLVCTEIAKLVLVDSENSVKVVSLTSLPDSLPDSSAEFQNSQAATFEKVIGLSVSLDFDQHLSSPKCCCFYCCSFDFYPNHFEQQFFPMGLFEKSCFVVNLKACPCSSAFASGVSNSAWILRLSLYSEASLPCPYSTPYHGSYSSWSCISGRVGQCILTS